MKREYFKRNHPLRIILSACVHLTDKDIERAEPNAIFLGLARLLWLKAQRIARRRGLDPLDAFQESYLEALRVAEKIDKKRPKEACLEYVITSCVWNMLNWSRIEPRVHDAFRMPQHVHEALHEIEKACDDLRKRHGIEASADELLAAVKHKISSQSASFYVDLYRARQQPTRSTQAVDKETSLSCRSNQQTLGELHGQVDPIITSLLDRTVIQKIFKTSFAELTPIEKIILTQRFGLDNTQPQTLKEIGDRFNLSRERIRQLQQQAAGKLRKKLLEYCDWSFDEILDALTAYGSINIVTS